MKSILRNKAKLIRSKLDVQSLSKQIEKNLVSLTEYQNAKNILCYYSFGSEVCTHNLLKDSSKTWFLPRINVDDLDICLYSQNCLQENKYHILEPTTERIDDYSLLEMIIIPALCADKNGYRIGYGKGFYDRLLKKLPKSIKKVILCYSEFVLENIFPDEHDEKADIIVSDENILII